jgi:hypothetical protein
MCNRAGLPAIASLFFFFFFFCLWAILVAAPVEALSQSVFFNQSTTAWTMPRTASNVKVTLYGGGGGSAITLDCAAGGGSGGAIANRTVNVAPWTGYMCLDAVTWNITIGAGGAPGTNLGGNGGATSIVATAPNGTELFRVTAYGGGGAQASGICCGGGGAGSDGSATNVGGGAGNPEGPGGCYMPPVQGTEAGDFKAGGTGLYVNREALPPTLNGAGWNGLGVNWGSTRGYWDGYCISAAGAAGFGGKGGNGDEVSDPVDAAPNSGAGGGTVFSCNYPGNPVEGWGGSGGATIAFDYTAVSPSPSPPPSTMTSNLKAVPNLKWLTAQANGVAVANVTTAGTNEAFQFVKQSNGKWTVRNTGRNKYMTVTATGVTVSSTTAGVSEQFDLAVDGANRNMWTIKSSAGTYLAADSNGAVLAATKPYVWVATTI